MGFDYRIEYKKGVENKVADALSRLHQEEEFTDNMCAAITLIQPSWMKRVVAIYDGDALAQEVITELITYPYNTSYFTYLNGVLRYKRRIYVGEITDFRKSVIDYFHSFVDWGSFRGICDIAEIEGRILVV